MPRLRAVRPVTDPETSASERRGKRELTHADVVTGNEQRREQIKQVDQGGKPDPRQQGDSANIRQNTRNVNRRGMR